MHIVAIKAINCVYDAEIPELEAFALSTLMSGGPVNAYLAKKFGYQLPIHPGMELTFLNSLVEHADTWTAIIKKY